MGLGCTSRPRNLDGYPAFEFEPASKNKFDCATGTANTAVANANHIERDDAPGHATGAIRRTTTAAIRAHFARDDTICRSPARRT